MAAVVQISVEGYFGEEVKSILNPRLGDLKQWTGSGFFFDTPYGDDLIMTNAHVVKNAKTIEIKSMLTSEEKFKAKLVGIVKNQEPDIAVIKLQNGELKRLKQMAASEIPYLSLRTENVSRGTLLKAIGYPLGMSEPNITGGEITNFISGDRVLAEKFVTNAAINPGNSGGPAIDENGNVIGINTSIIEEADNIGFITPANFMDIILKNIFTNNAICFSDLGATFQKNSPLVAKHLKLSSTNGLIVTELDKNGLLENAGLQQEDIIIKINDKNIDRHGIIIETEYFHRKNIFDIVKLIPIGEKIEISFIRKGKIFKKSTIAIQEPKLKIQSNPIVNERFFIEIWGLTIQILNYEILESFNLIANPNFYQIMRRHNENKERLIVTDIKKESPAYLEEWEVGEVIAKFNDIEIESMDQFVKLINKSNGVIKLISEAGMIGFFDSPNKNITMQNPTKFLK